MEDRAGGHIEQQPGRVLVSLYSLKDLETGGWKVSSEDSQQMFYKRGRDRLRNSAEAGDPTGKLTLNEIEQLSDVLLPNSRSSMLVGMFGEKGRGKSFIASKLDLTAATLEEKRRDDPRARQQKPAQRKEHASERVLDVRAAHNPQFISAEQGHVLIVDPCLGDVLYVLAPHGVDEESKMRDRMDEEEVFQKALQELVFQLVDVVCVVVDWKHPQDRELVRLLSEKLTRMKEALPERYVNKRIIVIHNRKTATSVDALMANIENMKLEGLQPSEIKVDGEKITMPYYRGSAVSHVFFGRHATREMVLKNQCSINALQKLLVESNVKPNSKHPFLRAFNEELLNVVAGCCTAVRDVGLYVDGENEPFNIRARPPRNCKALQWLMPETLLRIKHHLEMVKRGRLTHSFKSEQHESEGGGGDSESQEEEDRPELQVFMDVPGVRSVNEANDTGCSVGNMVDDVHHKLVVSVKRSLYYCDHGTRKPIHYGPEPLGAEGKPVSETDSSYCIIERPVVDHDTSFSLTNRISVIKATELTDGRLSLVLTPPEGKGITDYVVI